MVREAWSEGAGAFTQCVGSTALDAANLMMAIVDFLPATDPRMLSPRLLRLRSGSPTTAGLVHRCRTDHGVDGLPAKRAPSCSARFGSQKRWRWPIRLIEPEMCLSGPAGFAHDLDLLSEEVDRETGDGNLPRPSATSVSSTPPGQSVWTRYIRCRG